MFARLAARLAALARLVEDDTDISMVPLSNGPLTKTRSS
jgi:hypothetical protein